MQHLTADDIKSMSVEDYSKMRSLLMAGVKQQAEQEITESTCMWCGKGGWPDVDAHEAECEG